MKKLLATSIVAVGLAAAVPAAFAQTADAAATPRGPFAQRHHEQHAFRMPSERVEARLAYIHTALKISAAQQSQWDAYAGVLRKQASAMDQRMRERRAQMEKGPGERKRPSAVERHERQRQFMAVATQRLDELLTVEKPLYAALSPEQQRVADEVLGSRGRGPGGPGRFLHHGGFGRG
jgi:periplasmic protein CpxP/Spy